MARRPPALALAGGLAIVALSVRSPLAGAIGAPLPTSETRLAAQSSPRIPARRRSTPATGLAAVTARPPTAALALATPTAGRAALPPSLAEVERRHPGTFGAGAVRGLTIGPIESGLHPGRGYGSERCAQSMDQARRAGASWVSLTPFGRVWDLEPTGVDPSFEAPAPRNIADVERSIAQAHAAGLRVMLVPHLWVETGGWRALIDPKTDAGWRRWAGGYQRFVLAWAEVAERSGADLFSLGVELRSWVTTPRAVSFSELIRKVRSVYHGPLTYAANWDDVHDTVVLGELDVIGINAFFPLADHEGADDATLLQGATQVRARLAELAERWHKPVLFTEVGYTTRPDPAVKPWEWPDTMKDVGVDERAQARAYQALLAPFVDAEWFAGFFVWRVYADPDDMSQEAAWGFSPRGKLAELVVRDAFATHWAAEGPRRAGDALSRRPAVRVGSF